MPSVGRSETLATRPVFSEAYLTRVVSDLICAVEEFDLLVHSLRLMLQQRTPDRADALRQLTEIRNRVGLLNCEIHGILDEMAPPVATF